MKRYSWVSVIIILVGLVASVGICCAQEQNITLTTFYPSALGRYKMMRLYPRDDINIGLRCDKQGDMFYHKTNKKVYVCNGDGGSWVGVGAGGLWSRSENNVYPNPALGIENVGINTRNPDSNYALDVHGKVKAKNMLIMRLPMNYNTWDCASTKNWCVKTIYFPGDQFTSNPIVVCTGTSGSYPASCSARITFRSDSPPTRTQAEIVLTTHDPNYSIPNNQTVSVIAFEP
ncbi:MAG: hypothetical protein JSW40_00070 [Candidatus Omnitrophota bacterium]|nr:MAG: hypothetical protein JSW40_00070 [Candidatus Omnitrophota bacterium]